MNVASSASNIHTREVIFIFNHVLYDCKKISGLLIIISWMFSLLISFRLKTCQS